MARTKGAQPADHLCVNSVVVYRVKESLRIDSLVVNSGELRPRAMRQFAARTAKLTWSRAVLKLVVAELFPDDLFTQLVGNLDRVPRRQWPHVIAIAVAPRHSWRRDVS